MAHQSSSAADAPQLDSLLRLIELMGREAFVSWLEQRRSSQQRSTLTQEEVLNMLALHEALGEEEFRRVVAAQRAPVVPSHTSSPNSTTTTAAPAEVPKKEAFQEVQEEEEGMNDIEHPKPEALTETAEGSGTWGVWTAE
jgi:hypothetical protein